MRRRFYSANNDFVGIANLRHGPRSLAQAVTRKLFGRFPELPWIPFSAIHVLDSLICADWIAWEIGSGMSTLWLSHRVKHLTSIEASEEWYRRLDDILRKRNNANVELRFEWRGHVMSDFSEIKNGALDFILVDGGPRSECLFNGFSKVRSGGYLYLDNTDVVAFWPGLEDFLIKEASKIQSVRRFVDYVPGSFVVNEGTLIRKHCSPVV